MNHFATEDIVRFVLLAVWIGLIMYLSSGKNSVLRTLPIFAQVARPVISNADPEKLNRYHVIFRKIIHLVGYAILALIASMAFSNSTATFFVAEYWQLCAFAVTLAVASLDETRQYFDPDRVGSVGDVALDCIGGAFAILLFWLASL